MRFFEASLRGGYDEAEQGPQADWQLCEWVVEQLLAMLKEMFAPQSLDPRWKGVSSTQFLKAQLDHDVAAVLCSPLEFLASFGSSRSSCTGSRFIKWGPILHGNCSELDFTADAFKCYGH